MLNCSPHVFLNCIRHPKGKYKLFLQLTNNPPFVGKKYQNREQRQDLINVFDGEYKNVGTLDYVCGWYKKCADYIDDTKVECAFVSTNSITQGEAVGNLWKPLTEHGVIINFAWRTFRWDSESTQKAAVQVVIVGFAKFNKKQKYIFDNNHVSQAININGYLMNGNNIYVESRNKPLCESLKMSDGNVPIDGNFLKIDPEELAEIKAKEPNALKWIKKLVGSEEYINNKKRYVVWLVGCSPNELHSMPMITERVKKVRDFRLASITPSTNKLADRATTFRDTRNPDVALIIPRVSSENRKYIPMGFIDKSTIALNAVLLLPNATLYYFGILTSNVHMAWMRAVAGRLKSDYRYSKDIVYNNFPWPNPNAEQKAKIEQTAQGILDARNLYPESSLADLYDELTMPSELRKAHQINDKAVMEAYGFDWHNMTESQCVAELMRMYQKLVNKG